jgi:hypothetical protein
MKTDDNDAGRDRSVQADRVPGANQCLNRSRSCAEEERRDSQQCGDETGGHDRAEGGGAALIGGHEGCQGDQAESGNAEADGEQRRRTASSVVIAFPFWVDESVADGQFVRLAVLPRRDGVRRGRGCGTGGSSLAAVARDCDCQQAEPDGQRPPGSGGQTRSPGAGNVWTRCAAGPTCGSTTRATTTAVAAQEPGSPIRRRAMQATAKPTSTFSTTARSRAAAGSRGLRNETAMAMAIDGFCHTAKKVSCNASATRPGRRDHDASDASGCDHDVSA